MHLRGDAASYHRLVVVVVVSATSRARLGIRQDDAPVSVVTSLAVRVSTQDHTRCTVVNSVREASRLGVIYDGRRGSEMTGYRR